MRQATSLIVALALAGCGGGKPAVEPPPSDVTLEQSNTAGTQALTMDLPKVAVRQYTIALKRAYERDDGAAIADVAYNLALAQMQAGDAKAALVTVRDTRLELERRHAPVPPELILVQAASAYRLGDASAADRAAQEVLGSGGGGPGTAARAWYIKGMVAGERGDRALLAQAIAAIPAAKPSAGDGDRDELVGREALLDGRPADAQAAFEQAAAQRQQILDYRGMARALALAGDAALKANHADQAAVFYLRAGRSDLLQGDKPAGQALLQRAEDAARASNQAAIIEEVRRLRSAP